MIKKARVEARIDCSLKENVSEILRKLDISEAEAIRIQGRPPKKSEWLTWEEAIA